VSAARDDGVIVQLPASATLSIGCQCTLGEGILWWEERRSLIWTDIERSALWLHDIERGVTSTLTLPDRLGSLAICQSGRLVLGLAKGLFLGTFDSTRPGALHVELLAEVDAGLARHRINDGRTDRAGNFVFGTMNEAQDAPSGSFYQYSAAHGLRRLNLGGVTIPNSICFSLDGRTMYFCDSVQKTIRQCDYDAGSAGVSNLRDFVTLGPNDGLPDGSIVDREGCVWNAAWGVGRVRRYTRDGAIVGEVRVPAKNTTCVVFGGDNLADLYITSSRQEMTDDELAAVPSAGGVYHARIAPLGVSDTRFLDTGV
jgi:sugar lactone lactonase YvrE